MNIHSLIEKFAQLGDTFIGHGPKHPISPQPELQPEIESFMEKYPFLRQDQGYIDFLECYSGAMVNYPDGKLVIDIFGFLEDISLHLVKDENPVIDDNGFYGFCSSVVWVENGQDDMNNYIGIGYSFDSTGTRRWGIYRSIDGNREEWYCESFLEWLNKIIDKKGKLL